jgi:UDP:flavonoid glycosyltransferase YjiC (YdhE family)
LSRPLRIFLGAFGQPGHAFPMLALAARLAARGHEVSLETWSKWREHVQSAAVEFVEAPEYRFATPLPPYAAVARAALTTRAAIAARRPDAVVHDILTLAPALAAELEGVPSATLIPHVYPVGAPGFPPYALGARLPRTAVGRALWSTLDRPVSLGLRIGQRQLNETRRRLGLAELGGLHGGLSRRLVLVGTFPQLEYPRRWPPEVHVVGPLIWEPPAAEVQPPEGSEPLVLVAPSTAQDPQHRMLRAALSGLAGAPVRVLASTNARPLPVPLAPGPRQRLVDWVSYSRTMPLADLVICHAGHGTLVRALACGTPVLAVPHVGDMGENAARLDWSGAGLRLPWRLLSPATLRLAVSRALDPRLGFAARASEFAAWIQRHDPLATAAELVEELARSGG